MKKFFLFSLLFAATAVYAEIKVEDFTIKSGGTTSTYVTAVTTRECTQATWTFLGGGLRTDVGNFGSCAAVMRAKFKTEDVYPYFVSSTISGGIDSLWMTWNSNGAESGTWNIKVYINNVLVGSMTEAAGAKDDTPTKKFGIGQLKTSGDFTIKIVNECSYNGTSNKFRFVFDDLSWTTYSVAGEKATPTLEFAEAALLKNVEDAAFTNALTNTSDATPTFESSVPAVATVDANGEVTIVGVGTTTITASVAETDNFKPKSTSYDLRVVPMNFHLETFTGAANVTSGNGTYLTNDSTGTPSDATGISWTTLLGSVRDNLGGGTWATSNIAVAIRGKKSTEANYGYLLSSSIAGGIDSLAFDWTCNGSEAARQNPWNIKIYINDTEVGAITDACTAIPATPNRFSVGNLKVNGNFTIKIVNMNDADDDSGNQYRWVMDNLEWYSYSAGPATGVENTAVKSQVFKTIENGVMVIYRDGVRYNIQGTQF